MGIGCWLSFLTKYDRYCRDHKCRKQASITALGLTILKVTPLQARILQLNLLFKLMQQLIPEIAEALVNTNGELIGINSAIASQTGSYAGYSFAIPVNLAKKILDDLKSMVP
jgi:hypothetical protein